MKKKLMCFELVVLIVSVLFIYPYTNYLEATLPEIYSITPNEGSSTTPTQIEIKGANFNPPQNVALYGGGPYIAKSLGNCFHDVRGVYVKGTYAYVADYNFGLKVVDISDLKKPSIVGACNTPNTAVNVYVKDNYYILQYIC